MAQDETTVQSTASIENDEALGTEQQTPELADQEQSVQTDDQYTIPEKFVNKSASEIYQYYRELEVERGRLANELGTERKAREEQEEKYRELERAASQYQAPQQYAQPQQAQPQSDPYEVLNSKFDEDPKAAMLEYARLQQEQLENSRRQEAMQQRAARANDYYWSQKKENPDYARLEPEMGQLLKEFENVVKPEFANSPQVLRALYDMARGRNLDYYTKSAVEQAQKDGLSVLEEKRASQSETGHSSESESKVDIRKMTTEQMEQFFGERDD